MIKVVIKETDKINSVEISGHSGYDVHGKDIVCASVSSIILTVVNCIMNIDNSSIEYIDDGDMVSITKINDNKTIDTLLDTMISILKDLENQYKENIKIESEE